MTSFQRKSISTEITEADHLSKNMLHVVSNGKIDEKAETERFSLIKSMSKRGTPNAVQNKWKPIVETTTKDVLKDERNDKTLKSIEAFEARKKMFQAKQSEVNAVKLREKRAQDEARAKRMAQRRSLYESPSLGYAGTTYGASNNGNAASNSKYSSNDEKNNVVQDNGPLMRSHSVVNAVSVYDRMGGDSGLRKIERYGNVETAKISSHRLKSFNNSSNSSESNTQLPKSASQRLSSSSYQSKFAMFERNSVSNLDSGLRPSSARPRHSLATASANQDQSSPFNKNRFNSGRSVNTNTATTSSHSISEDPSKENVAPKPRSRNYHNDGLPKPTTRGQGQGQTQPEVPKLAPTAEVEASKTATSIIQQPKSKVEVEVETEAVVEAPIAAEEPNKLDLKEHREIMSEIRKLNSARRPQLSESNDDVFDQKPIEISEREETEDVQFRMDQVQLQEFEDLGLSETARRAILSRASEIENGL